MNLIRRHKGLALIGGLTLILVMIILIIFANMFFSTGNSVYGQRLNDIVKIDGNVNDSIIAELSELEEVVEIDIRTQGKIIYTTILFKEGTSVAKAKEIAAGTVSKYNEEIIGYYDFGYFLEENVEEIESEDGETQKKTGFIIAGTKHPDNENVSWTKS